MILNRKTYNHPIVQLTSNRRMIFTKLFLHNFPKRRIKQFPLIRLCSVHFGSEEDGAGTLVFESVFSHL